MLKRGVTPADDLGQEPRWFGQPRGLTILVLTNMWEQFSYYGMRVLLVYYMVRQLSFEQGHASLIYGAYTAGAYLTPIAGGVMADRVLGKHRAVLIGGSIMAVGHFMMAAETLFYVALITIAVGNGLFLPTLPSQLNDLYPPHDPGRASAYNLYYLGVNAGGFLAPLTCGVVGEVLGWHYGFALAGIGMVIGLIIYASGRRHLPPEPPRNDGPRSEGRERLDPRTFLVLTGVALAVATFRGAYEQLGNTIPLWIEGGVRRGLMGSQVPGTWFLALNPLFVMTLTPLLVAHLRRGDMRRTGRPRLGLRMAIGALIVAASYVFLAFLAGGAGDEGVNALWLLPFFLLLTLGELLILPTGLGLFARLAPARLGASTVAGWYVTIFAGSVLAGVAGTAWSSLTPPTFFIAMAALCVAAAAMLLSLDRGVHTAIETSTDESADRWGMTTPNCRKRDDD